MPTPQRLPDGARGGPQRQSRPDPAKLSVEEHRVEHRPIRRRQIQGCPASSRLGRRTTGTVRRCHGPAPHRGAGRGERRRSASTRAGCGTCRPVRTTSRPSRRVDVADPVGVIDQLLTDRHDGVHHGVPAAAEIAGDVGDGASVATDLQRHPPCCPGRQRAARPSRSRGARRTSSDRIRCIASVACATPVELGRPNTGKSTSTTSRTP